MTALLKVSSIETLYFDRIYALFGVSLEIEEGEIFTVRGPNGAGKTTLLRTIAGLLKDQPKKGEILFAGRRIDGWQPEAVARLGIVYVPEDRGLFREVTGAGDLEARGRAERARGRVEGSDGERGRARGLPRRRHGGGGRERLAALPEEEAMVMTDAARSVPALFAGQVERQGDRLAIRFKEYGIWHRVTWRQYGEEVRRVATALLAFGLRRQENVAVLAENRPEWLYCHLGIQTAGGVTVGIYPTSAPEQITYLLNHSEARLIFVENEEQLDKILAIVDGPKGERVVGGGAKGRRGVP